MNLKENKMGKLLNIIIGLIITTLPLNLKSQDCTSINNFTSYRGIKFGEPLPNKFRSYFTSSTLNEDSSFFSNFSYYKKGGEENYYLPDSIKRLLDFGIKAESMAIAATKKGEIFCIYLRKDWTDWDSSAVKEGKIPISYKNATDLLSSLFGNTYKEFVENDNLEIGYYFRRVWECDRMKISLTLNNSLLKGFNIEIVDKKLEKKHKIDKYSN